MSDDETALHVPAQVIPAPDSISPQGRAYLAAAAKRIFRLSTAEQGSQGGAQDQGPTADTALLFLRPLAARFKGSLDSIALPKGAKLYCATPEGRAGRCTEVAYLDIHGGGFVSGGGEMCELLAKIRASEYGVETFAVDYRLAPANPYPAALDDCMAAYREVLRRREPSSLIVAGGSAGGNLAAALMLRARDEALPLPAALLLQTPALDLTCAGDTHKTNRFLDVNLHGGGAEDVFATYSGATERTHPYVSPLFGDFTKGWPRTLLTAGTRDVLLSNTVRMHRMLRRAGIQAELHVAEAGPHGGFMGANAPEDAEILAECRRFVLSVWGMPALGK
jgi:acetyl esterase/lipase